MNNTDTAVISLENITKKYLIQYGKEPTFKGAVLDWLRKRQTFTSFPAPQGINLRIEKGETVGIIGENGSGKSTLLEIVAGIVKPTSGTVSTRGSIATLIELGAGFHGDLSGRENIYLNGSILGFSKKEMDRKYRAIVEFSELQKFINTPVKYYSSGMYVRLGFAIAVEVDPDILLVDEVLAVGDEHFQNKCLRRISKFQDEGKTILFVSHALDLVEEICSRVVLLAEGKIKKQGKPREVLKNYRKIVRNKDEQLKPRESGTKDAVIESVEFLGKEGEKKTRFLTADTLVARIHYHAPTRIESPVFGFSIHGQDGKNFFGSNTQLASYPLEYIEGNGSIKLIIDRLSLFKGNFFFNFSLHSFDHKIQYHRLDFFYQIEVENPRQEDGFLKMPHRWDFEAKDDKGMG